MTLSLPAFAVLLLSVPVLLAGEGIVRRTSWLRRLNIPAAVVGGLLAAALVLAVNASGAAAIVIDARTSAPWWSWFVTIEPAWLERPAVSVMLPLMVGFFTCIGLNASWQLLRPGALLVLQLLAITILLAVVQNFVGLALAPVLGVSPLLGLVCGSLTLAGGPGTAVSFAPEFEKLGLSGAVDFALAAATFGIVTGGLVGGPVGAWLIRRRNLRETAAPATNPAPQAGAASTDAAAGLFTDVRRLRAEGATVWPHIVALVVCMKAGAWLTYFMQQAGLFFALQIGAMIFGVILRNVHDALGWNWIRTATLQTLATVLLGLFITAAMMTINLRELAAAGGPMLAILLVQVGVMIVFALLVTFPVMGRNYDAAVMSAGHIGFGLGITANAVANMQSLAERFGPSPRAFLAVPIVGGFLMDFANGLLVTFFLQWFG